MECGLWLFEPAPREDVTTALVEPFHRVIERIIAPLVIVFVFDGQCRVGPLSLQISRRRVSSALIFVIRLWGGVKADVLTREARFHLEHGFGFNPQIGGNRFDFLMVKPAQALFGTAEVKK